METGLHVLVLTAAVGAHVRALETGRRAWRLLCGPLFGALALSRPEGIVFLFAALAARGALLWREGKRPDFADAGFVVLALIPPVAYAFWRHGQYGVWLPNTFYAKAGAGLSTWADGVRYLLEALGPTLWGNALLLPLVFVGLAPWRKATARTLALLAAIGAQAFFIVVGGGDWMPGWRFAVPAVPLLALLAPSIIERLKNAANHKRVAEWTAGWRRVVVALLVVLPLAAHLYAVKHVDPAPSGWQGLRTAEMFAPDYDAVAMWLSARARPGDWLATGEAGLIPYLTGLPTIDCFGLTDAHLARLSGKRHEKVDPDYIVGRRPRFIVIGGTRVSGDRLTSDFAYGRSLLAHPRVESEYALAFRLHSFVVLQRRGDIAL
jgi:hypothetical protein